MSSKRKNKYALDINDYKICKSIKKGAFGIVYEIKNKTTNKRFAAKVIPTADSEQAKQTIDGEIRIMVKFSHPTMTNFIGFSNVDFDGNDNITIIMELAEKGSLFDVLKSVKNGLAEDKYDNTARQIILVGISYGMMQLHQNRVMHRDLKPGNILIDESFHPRITDFGLSKIYELDHSKSQSKECGTPGYMAPEVINGDSYSWKADVYSFSIIMYEVITDLKPFPLFEKNFFQLNQKIVNDNYRPQFTFPINKHLKKLIQQCWSKESDERPSFENIYQLLAHDQRFYLDDVDVDELENCIDFITKNEIVIRDISHLTFKSQFSSKKHEKSTEELQEINKQQNQLISDLIEQAEKQNKEMQILKKQNEQKDELIKKLNFQLQNKDDFIKKLKQQNESKDNYIKKLKQQNENKDEHIKKLNIQIENKDDYIKKIKPQNKTTIQSQKNKFQYSTHHHDSNDFLYSTHHHDSNDFLYSTHHYDSNDFSQDSDGDKNYHYYRDRDPPFEYGKDHIHHLNDDIKETGDYLKDRQLKIDSMNAQHQKHVQLGNRFNDLYKRLNVVEEKLKEEEKTMTNGKQFFSNYDKPRLDYLNEYLNIQDQLRKSYPETRNDLNQRTKNVLNTLYRERGHDEWKTGVANRLMSGIGYYQSNSSVKTMIQRLESYLRNA